MVLLLFARLSEASTHLLQAIRELPCQSLNTGRLIGVPALFLTAVRTLFLQNSFHEAETLCDELLTSYEGIAVHNVYTGDVHTQLDIK